MPSAPGFGEREPIHSPLPCEAWPQTLFFFFFTRIINLGSKKGAKGKNEKYQGVPEVADPRKTSASVQL